MPDRVLLTGISGFLGGHVGLQLLQAGYLVRGSVRSLDKADKVRATLVAAGADVSKLEFVALDLLSGKGWGDAMQDIRYLQHTASPFVSVMPADPMDLIRPAIEGTRFALEAALAAKVERVVLTSSVAAVSYGHDKTRTRPFTADDWTDLEGRGVNAYIESKTRAEREAWAIMDRAGRHGDLAVINPSAILGPLLDDDPGTSAALVARLLNGTLPAAADISFAFIDVRDVAALHVRAMTDPAAGGHRFIAGNRVISMMDAANMLRPVLPAYASKMPRFVVPDWLVRMFAAFDKEMRGNTGELGVKRYLDASAAIALLGRPFISSEDAVVATAQSLIARKLV